MITLQHFLGPGVSMHTVSVDDHGVIGCDCSEFTGSKKGRRICPHTQFIRDRIHNKSYQARLLPGTPQEEIDRASQDPAYHETLLKLHGKVEVIE